MLWQDWVISICQSLFAVALIPTIKSKDKPPLLTAFMNAILVTIVTFTLLTLSLWLSALTAGLVAICWYIIAYQKYHQKKS